MYKRYINVIIIIIIIIIKAQYYNFLAKPQCNLVLSIIVNPCLLLTSEIFYSVAAIVIQIAQRDTIAINDSKTKGTLY